MTKPTIGRVMWLKDSTLSEQFLACSVAYVHGLEAESVNIGGLNAHGAAFSRCNVPVFQGDAEECPEGQVCWMPYQKAQAAKAATEEDDSEKEETSHKARRR